MDDDSPETITASFTLGIQHPPGYPLAALLGRLACLVPVGNACFRVNLLSASIGSLAILLLAWILFHLLRNFRGVVSPPALRDPEVWGLAVATSLLLAFSQTYWEKAVGAKGMIYLLETLLVLGLFGCLVAPNPAPSRSPAWLYLFFFLWGTGLAHHWQTQILFFPLLIIFFLKTAPDKIFWVFPSLKSGTRALAIGLLGLSPLLYLPLRAHQFPFLNLGAPDTFRRFLASLSRSYYLYREKGVLESFFQAVTGATPWSLFLGQFHFIFDHQGRRIPAHLLANMGIPVLLLALVGFFYWQRTNEKKILLSILLPALLLLTGLYAAPTDPSMVWYLDNFMIPLDWMTVILVAVGAYAFLSQIVARNRPKVNVAFLLAALCFLPLYRVISNFQALDQERQMARYDYGTNLLKSIPTDSIFFAEGDEDYFPLYYFQGVECLRHDVVMIPTFTLFESWGVEQTKWFYPDLQLTIQPGDFNAPIPRIMGATSELIEKNRDKIPCSFSNFNGAFHRYYLSQNPSLLFRRSGLVLEFDSPLTRKGPWLVPAKLRVRHLLDCPSNAHPSLEGIWGIYQKIGYYP